MANRYYGVRCKNENCKRAIKLGPLDNPAENMLVYYTPPLDEIECSICGASDTYGSGDIIEFETDEEPGFGLPQ